MNDRFLSLFFEEARELLQALEAGLVDRVVLYVAPKVLGSGIAWAEAGTLPDPLGSPGWRFRSVSRKGIDLRIDLDREP